MIYYTYREVSARFKVSLSAIGKWYKRYQEEGSYEQKNRNGSARKIDAEKLKIYAQMNPDMKLKEAAKEFKVSLFAIRYWLRELGFSYKKTFSYLVAIAAFFNFSFQPKVRCK
jgi:transposase